MSAIRSVAGFALALLLLAGGCAKPPTPPPEDPTEKNLRLVAMAYLDYVGKKQAAPARAEDLTPILTEMGGNPADILRSDRDREPFVILWNVEEFPAIAVRKMKDKAPPRLKNCVLAYEKQGSGGYRFVAFSNAYVAEMSDDELAKAHFPPNHKFR